MSDETIPSWIQEQVAAMRAERELRFPIRSYRRFNRKLQLSRLGAFSILLITALGLRATTPLEFATWEVFAIYGAAAVSVFFFHRLYVLEVEDRWPIPIYPLWMLTDVLLITWSIYATGDPWNVWFMMYIINTTAAAFSEGGRAAVAVALLNTVSYLTVVYLFATPETLAVNLRDGAGRMVLMYGICFFMLRGITALRWNRLKVKHLVEDKDAQLQMLLELTEELEAANARIGEADRAKSQFLANMSHELRTPLNAIIGFSEILDQRLGQDLDARFQKFLKNITGSGRHLLALINDILDLSKVEAGKMECHYETVAVEVIVDSVLGMLEVAAGKKGVRLDRRMAAELPQTIVADGPKVKQILYNLVSNAVKFSSEGGTVRVGCRPLTGKASPLPIDALEFTVADEGIGIPADRLESIFEEFAQVDAAAGRQYEGTGLGLALVRRYCDLMGGTVAVDSVLDEGSTFRVVLPTNASHVEASGEIEQEPRPEPTESSDGRKTVLVVEDDDAFASSLVSLLQSELDLHVVRARNGREAFRLLERVEPDLVTLDLVLPDFEGWEVLKAMKRSSDNHETPVIIISMVASSELGLTLGAEACFMKPLQRASFTSAVEEILERPELSDG